MIGVTSIWRLVLWACLSILAVPSLGTSAGPPDPEAIEAKVLPPLVKHVVDLLTPVHFTGVGEAEQDMPLTLVKVVSCGAGTRQTVKLLGVVFPGEKPALAEPILREEDCRVVPATILKRIIAQPDMPHWVGLMELNARWGPWEIELSSTKLHGLAKSAHPKIDVRVTPQVIRRDYTSFVLPLSNGKTLPVNLAMGEAGNAMIINALIDDPPAVFTPRFQHPTAESLPTGTNAIVTIPHTGTSTVLGRYFRDETFVIPLLQSGPALTAKNPTIDGGRDRYVTTSVLGIREYPDAFNLELEWAGKDLRLVKLALTARRLACGTDVVCSMKRAGADALASSIGQLLKSQYNHSFLRSFILQDVLAIKVNNRQIKIHVEVLRAESSPTLLILYTKVAFIP